MTQKNSNRSSQRLLVLGTVVTLCVLLGGGVWLLSGWLDLFRHIIPSSDGPNMAQSDSMEPFDIKLKTKVNDEKNGYFENEVEWHLKVPRAYITNVDGENGAVRHGGLDENGNVKAVSTFDVAMQMHVLPDGQTVEPISAFKPATQQLDDNTIRFGVVNNKADWWVAKNNLCVPQHLHGELADEFGGSNNSSTQCYPTIKYCIIVTQLDGWRIAFSTTKKLYAQPETTCSLVKAFLDKYTIKRDHYPVSEPTHYMFPQKKN